MRSMDRYLLMNFLVAWAICYISMVGLYIIIDLFSNADEFLEDKAGTLVFLRRAGKFYFLHSFEYFNKLAPIITQIAAMTTLATLHRNNEIVALLAAGVPTRRALVPILMGAALMIGLSVLNRELVLPAYSEELQRLHEDIEANRTLLPNVQIDSDQVLIRANTAHREDFRLEGVNVTLPMEVAGQLQEVRANTAYYRTHEPTGDTGWVLVQPTPVKLLRPSRKLIRLDDGNLFLVSNVSFDAMIRRNTWLSFASTWEMISMLQRQEIKQPKEVRIMVHERLMQPVLNLLLVFIGVPFVLQWERKNIYRSIAVSMLLSAVFYAFSGTAGFFATYGYVEPLTAAWMPILVFGPVAVALMSKIGT